jgi:hypothetical protein
MDDGCRGTGSAHTRGMPTIIKASDGADLLALIPHLTGYRPRNSIVLVAFRGKRTCAALRFDIPAPAGLAGARRTATGFIGILCRIPGVDAVVPALYTDAAAGTDSPGAPPPVAEFIDVLIHRAEVAGLEVKDALFLAADGWGSYLDESGGVRPVADVEDSPVLRLADSEDFHLRESVTAGTDLPTVGPFEAEHVARLIIAFDDAAMDAFAGWASANDVPDDTYPVALLDALLEHDPSSLPPEVVAFAISAMQTSSMQDVVLATWAFDAAMGRRLALEAEIYEHTGTEDLESRDIGRLWGVGPRPDPARIERGIELLRSLCANAPRSLRPRLFGMLAWSCWALGQCSRAAIFVENARAIDPGESMTRVVGSLIETGRLPEWAFEVPEVDETDVRYASA